MKKFLPFIVLLVFVSCNSGTSSTSADSSSVSNTDKSKKEVSYPYPIGYSTQFEMGDPEKSKTILDLWKDFDNNTLDHAASSFADTVTMMLSGMETHTSRDSTIASTKAYRGSLGSVTSKVDVVMSVKSTDKNEDWVLVWGTEIHKSKKNITDSVYLHEIWRFNKDGKVDYMEQFSRQPVAKK